MSGQILFLAENINTSPRTGVRTGVLLTAYGAADGRLERLQQVFNLLVQLWPDVAEKIIRLHDHKGWLGIFWRVPPVAEDRQIAAMLWASTIANEQISTVEHHLYEAREI